MTTTIASLLKRLEAEEGRRATGDNELRGFINKLGLITDGLNEQDIATDKRLGIVEDNLATLEARAFPVEPPPVEPPPVGQPPTAKPERIWNSDSDWHIRWPSRPGAVTEVDYEGRRALKMAVLSTDGSPGDTTHTTTRAQRETEGFLKEGEQAFFRGRFNLPSNFPIPAPGWGVNLVEFYAEKGDGSPPWQIQVRGDRIQTRYLGGTLLWDAPAKDYVGRYVTYALGVDWGKGGSLEMHIDDLSGEVPVIRRQPIDKMLGSFSGNARFIIQCYYPAGSDITVYHENEVVMGRTLESVR